MVQYFAVCKNDVVWGT